jgi:hypothetical protein
MQADQARQFKDPSGLMKWTIWLMYAYILLTIFAVYSNALAYQLLSDFQNGTYVSEELALADAEVIDAQQGRVGLLQIVLFISSGILMLRWIYRANSNARHLGASEMTFTPGWAVGWYFVPVATLWKPYQAMKEIWKASTSPQDWTAATVSPLLSWWWFFWIVSNAAGNAALRMGLRAEELDELIAVNTMTQLSDLTAIPLTVTAILLIRKVNSMQMLHAERLGLTQTHMTPSS